MATPRHRHTANNGFHHHFYNGNPKFVTVVMPSVVNPNGRQKRLEAIHDTWGPYARAIYVLHEITEFEKASHLTMSLDRHPYDRYSFPQNLLLPEDINVDQGISRLYHTIQMIHERVDPDFAFFVNDHTYVIPSHLCHYLESLNPDVDLYAGHALKNDKSSIFNSGAAGYILSRETMKKLIQKFKDQDEHCWIDTSTTKSTQIQNRKWLEGNPALVIVDCLRSMDIVAIDTREGHTYHRFHAFPLVRMVSGDVDTWYINKHQFDEIPNDLRVGFDSSYSTLLVGTDCCAKDSISFHYVEAMECKGLFAVQKALLDHPQMTDTELQTLMEQHWPKDVHDIGGYSRPLPKSNNVIEWKDLLTTIRKISRKETQADC
jgi:glycoprotein-N-acetylgalactosamine 3-beta-galactosyltransferase